MPRADDVATSRSSVFRLDIHTCAEDHLVLTKVSQESATRGGRRRRARVKQGSGTFRSSDPPHCQTQALRPSAVETQPRSGRHTQVVYARVSTVAPSKACAQWLGAAP